MSVMHFEVGIGNQIRFWHLAFGMIVGVVTSR